MSPVQRRSSAAWPPRTDPPAAGLLYALDRSARASQVFTRGLWLHRPLLPTSEPSAPFFCTQTQPEFSDVPRLYEAMGEAEQVLKALEEDRDDDGEDDGAP